MRALRGAAAPLSDTVCPETFTVMLTATLVPVEPVSCVNDTDEKETGKVNVVVVVDVVVMA